MDDSWPHWIRSDYVYLMHRERFIPGVDDGKEFVRLKMSMSGMGIDEDDQVCSCDIYSANERLLR